MFPPPGISTVVNTVSLPCDWDIDCEGIGGCPRQLGFIDRRRFSNNTTEHTFTVGSSLKTSPSRSGLR